MKIHPPRVQIDEQDAFANALFDRKEFGLSLTELLRNTEEGVVVFINAPWGEGKTTFSEMWRAHLRSQKLEAIYYDSYASDYFADPFLSFSAEILGLLDKRLADAEGTPAARREFKKAAIEVGKKLAALGAKVGLKALTMGAVDSGVMGELKTIGEGIADGTADIGAEIIEKRLENLTKDKDALKSFKDSLGKLAQLVRSEQGFPLTILVDELDRCRPDYALNLLERIKHLFDVKDVAFVLLVNQEQIESYVRTVYGERVDARSYLLKFAHVFVDLPRFHRDQHAKDGRVVFAETLIAHFDLPIPSERDFTHRSIFSVVKHFKLSLREIEKMFITLALYYGSLPKNQFTNGYLVALLAALKITKPDFYRILSSGSADAKTFFKETYLDALSENDAFDINPSWLKTFLDSLLLSESELSVHPKKGEMSQLIGGWLAPHRIGPRAVIPFLCARLDRFSPKPKS